MLSLLNDWATKQFLSPKLDGRPSSWPLPATRVAPLRSWDSGAHGGTRLTRNSLTLYAFNDNPPASPRMAWNTPNISDEGSPQFLNPPRGSSAWTVGDAFMVWCLMGQPIQPLISFNRGARSQHPAPKDWISTLLGGVLVPTPSHPQTGQKEDQEAKTRRISEVVGTDPMHANYP